MTIMNPSPTQHITSNTYVFTSPIKLTQNNFMLWKSHVVSSIRANELEGLIDGSHTCPPRCFSNPRPNQTTITTPNPEYQIWKKHDHILLSWLLSSLSEGVLGTVVDCSTHVKFGQLLPINMVQEQGLEFYTWGHIFKPPKWDLLQFMTIIPEWKPS